MTRALCEEYSNLPVGRMKPNTPRAAQHERLLRQKHWKQRSYHSQTHHEQFGFVWHNLSISRGFPVDRNHHAANPRIK